MEMETGTASRDEENWRAHIEAWRKSELTQAAYCEKHGLSKSAFTYRKKKLGYGDETRKGRRRKTPAFIEVKTGEPPAPGPRARLALEITGVFGLNIRLNVESGARGA